MLEFLAPLGQASVSALWLPIALWTVVALLTEAALRLTRADAALALPIRGATLAALPLVVALPAVLRALAPEAAIAVASAAPVQISFLPEVVVGSPVAAPETAGPAALDVLLGAAVVAVALVSALALVRLGTAVAATALASRRLPSAPEAAQRRLDAACARLGVTRRVRAVTAPAETPPFTVGWRRPIVAVPEGLEGDALDLALLHEAAHVCHGDFAWHAAQRAATALFAAHPMTWVLGRALDLDRERAADAAVLSVRPGRRRAYADLLFSFASVPAPPLALGATPGSSTLKTRLDAMTRLSSPLRRAWMAHLGRFGGALLFVLAGSLTLAATAQPPPPPPPASPVAPEPPPPPFTPDGVEAIQQIDVWQGGDETRVEIQLKPGFGHDIAAEIAGQYSSPTGNGRIVVQYDGGAIRRNDLDSERMFPPPPPPAPVAPEPPPAPPSTQSAWLEGVVTDADTREPLVGANVVVVGTSVGAATGIDGAYRINVPDGDQVVEVSYVGYETRSILVTDGQRELNVALTTRDAASPNVARRNDSNPAAPDIFEVAEVQPILIGGLGALQSRIVYPAVAKAEGIEGQVVIQFVVNEEGRVTSPRVLRSPDDRLSAAALTAVSASRFEPGMQRGQPVKVRFAVPVTFRLPGDNGE